MMPLEKHLGDLVAADVLAVVGERERVGVLERGWCGEAGGVALGLDDALDGVPQLLADAVVVRPEVQLQQGALGMMASATLPSIVATLAEVTGIAFEPEVAPRRPGDPARIVASWEHAARDLDWKMRHNHVGHGAQRVVGSPVVAALTRPSAAAPREPGLVLDGDVETPTRAIPDEHPMRCNGDVARGCGAVAGACPSPHVRVRHRHRVA